MRWAFPNILTLAIFVLFGLPCPAEDLRSFELQIAPTFHDPVILNVTKSDKHYFFRIRVWNGRGGFDWGKISTDHTRELTPDEVKNLSALLKPLDLTKLKAAEDFGGLDGTTWTLSFADDSNTKLKLWSPNYDKGKRGLVDFVFLCEYLWKLSGQKWSEE